MSRIDTCYATCHLETKNVAPPLPVFEGIKQCVQYLYIHPHEPIFYTYNYYDVSNVIILTLSENQVEDYTIENFYNATKMRIMLELSTEDSQFQEFLIF